MPNEPVVHPVYKTVNKMLTIWRIDRRFFFLAVIMGGATFNLFGSLVGGILIFVGLYLFGRWATGADTQILRILLNSAKQARRYDPQKRTS